MGEHMGQAPTVRVLNDVDEAICSALLVVNCLYVVGDYRAAGIAVNMPILVHIHYNQYLRRFRTFAQYICKYC